MTGAKIRNFEDNRHLSTDQIKVLRKKNILLQSATTSYSELYDTTSQLFQENSKKLLKRAQTYQFNTDGFESHTVELPSNELQGRRRSNSEDRGGYADENSNSNFILINSQDVWESNFANIKLEEMEEEKAPRPGDLTSEKTASEAIPGSQPRVSESIPCNQPDISESLGAASQYKSQEQNAMEEEPVPQQKPTEAMDIELENKDNQEHQINSEVLGRATVLTDAQSIFFEDEDTEKAIEEEEVQEGQEKMKDIPIARTKSILKRGSRNDSGSEIGSVRSRSRSRSNSRSEKRVQFQGLSEGEDKDSEVELNPRQLEKKEQKKSQISMISRLLQQRLEKEEQERRISNPVEIPETKETAELTAGTVQMTDVAEQQKTITKLLHLQPDNREEPIQNVQASIPSTATFGASADLIHKHMANTFTLAPPVIANEQKIRENKIASKEDTKPSESQRISNGKPEASRPAIYDRKKAPTSQSERSSRGKLFEDKDEPDNIRKGKLFEITKEKKDEKISQKDDKANKKPLSSPSKETLDSYLLAKKANETKNQKPDIQEVSKPKETASSKAQNTFLKGLFRDEAEVDSTKKKNLVDKILKAKEPQSNHHTSDRDYYQDEGSNDPRGFLMGSQSTEDNSKSIHQEIEEFLQKVREKRNQEKNQTEEQAFDDDPHYYHHRKGRGYYRDEEEDEEDDDGLLIPSYEKHQNKKSENKRSKISVRNAGNMDISLEFDDGSKRASANTKIGGSKSSKPIKKIIIEPTPNDEEDDEYEEIILVRRKVKGNHHKNTGTSTANKRNEVIEIESERSPSPRPTETRKQTQKDKEIRSTTTKPEYYASRRDTRYALRNKKKESQQRDFEDEASNTSAEDAIYIDSDPEPPKQKKTKTSTGAVPATHSEATEKSKVTTRSDAKKKYQDSEHASETVRRLLEGKPKPSAQSDAQTKKDQVVTQSKKTPEPEIQLMKNKRGEETPSLQQKLSTARKKNVIEEEDPTGDPDEPEQAEHGSDDNQCYFEDSSSAAINKFQELNYDYLFTGKKQQRRPRRAASKSAPESQNSQESLAHRAKPLVSFPQGVVLTQSQHVRKMKKVQNASQSSSQELDEKAKKALDKLFGFFIDKKTL